MKIWNIISSKLVVFKTQFIINQLFIESNITKICVSAIIFPVDYPLT